MDTSSQRQALIIEALVRIDGQSPTDSQPSAKHLKMAANPFRFLRGSAQLFYADIKNNVLTLPEQLVQRLPLTAVIGDCHLSNFGFLTEEGSHGDTVIFAPNDFDDACIGSPLWDITRFAVSLFLAADYAVGLLSGRYHSDEDIDLSTLRAADQQDAVAAVGAFLQAYGKACAVIIDNPDYRMHTLNQFGKGHVLAKLLKKATRRASGGKQFYEKSALAKAVDFSAERPVFRQLPDRFKPLPTPQKSAIEYFFRPYVDDAILDSVERLGAGTGSVNMARFYLLVGPEDYRGAEDLVLCHIVEVKQQRQAAPIYYFPDISPVNRLNHAHLTVDCQRLMQRRPDLVLDEAYWQDAHWLIRSRHHARVGIDPEAICLGKKKVGKSFRQYAAACGDALALAHARGDRRSTRFEAAVVKHLSKHIEELIEISQAYAEQVIADTACLKQLL